MCYPKIRTYVCTEKEVEMKANRNKAVSIYTIAIEKMQIAGEENKSKYIRKALKENIKNWDDYIDIKCDSEVSVDVNIWVLLLTIVTILIALVTLAISIIFKNDNFFSVSLIIMAMILVGSAMYLIKSFMKDLRKRDIVRIILTECKEELVGVIDRDSEKG